MWPWRKAEEPEPERVTPPAPAPPPAGWREVGPIQRAVATPSLISPATRMSATLSSWQNPTFLAPLGHVVSPDAPSGIVHDLPVPVQKAADGPELVVPTPKSTSSQRTVVSRALAMFSSTPEPTAPTLSASPLSSPALDEPATVPFDPAPAVHAGDAPQGEHASHDHAPLPLASPPAPTVQRVVAADPPTARFTTASDAGLPVVTLRAIAEPSPTPPPSTPDIAEAPTLGTVTVPAQSAPEPPEPAAQPAAPPPAAIQRAAEPSAPELPLASVQRSTPPPAGRRLGLGAPLIPSPGPASPSATELPLQAPAAGVSGDALPATPPPAIVAAPDTPAPSAEPSPAHDLASLLGDAPLVQRSVAEPEATTDVPTDDGPAPEPAELPVGTAPTPPPPLSDTPSPAGSLPVQTSTSPSPTFTTPTLGASSTPPVVLRSAADASTTPPAGSTPTSASSASASPGSTSPGSAPLAGFSSAGTDPTGAPLASIQRASSLPTSALPASTPPTSAASAAAPTAATAVQAATAAQTSTLPDLPVIGATMAGTPATSTSTPTDPAVQRATALPLVDTPTRAPDTGPAPDAPPAPPLVVAQLIGDRSLPLRAAPEPEAPTPAPAPANASVQRWADPYGSAQPASLPGTAPGGGYSTSTSAVHSPGGATASAAGYPNVQRSTAPATIATETRGAGGGMASDWLAPPMTDVATLPAVPIQRATSPAPSGPHPNWSAGQPVGPVVAPTVQRARVSDPAPVRMEFVNPVVARVPEEAPADPPAPAAATPVEPPPAAEPPAAQAPGPQAPAAPGAPAAAGTPEEMLAKIFDPLLRRLKTELRLDRERHGSLTDLRH